MSKKSSTDTRHAIARLLLQNDIVILSQNRPFTYASGSRGPIYCDNRLLMGIPAARECIRDQFIAMLKQQKITYDIIAGTATAGIPHAAWLADKLRAPMIYVRSSTKQHGKQNLIEGKLAPGQRVVLIEDLINTGGSSIASVNAIREAGGVVTACLAIMTYDFAEAKTAFQQARCPLFTLTDIHALLDVALAEKRITKDHADLVRRWWQNPKNWASKEGFA